jgi:uncharacterized membrane protein
MNWYVLGFYEGIKFLILGMGLLFSQIVHKLINSMKWRDNKLYKIINFVLLNLSLMFLINLIRCYFE